jgi:serine/threonine protein kinase
LKEVRGTFAYSDPAVFGGEPYNSASDVYSLGIIFWELACRLVKGRYEQPYGEFSNIRFDFQIIVQAATQNLRPTIPEGTPATFKNLITEITKGAQGDRPKVGEVLQRLHGMLDKIRPDGELD